MELVYYLVKGLFIMLGIVAVLLGKLLPVKYLVRIKEGYKVIDEKKHIKYSRITLYILGFYYIAYGAVMMFIKAFHKNCILFEIILPWLIVIAGMYICRRYIKK